MLEKSTQYWITRPTVIAAFKYLRSKIPQPPRALPPVPGTIPLDDATSGAWYRAEMSTTWGKNVFSFQADTRTLAYRKAREWATRITKQSKAVDSTKLNPYTLYLDKCDTPVDYVMDVSGAWWFDRDLSKLI